MRMSRYDRACGVADRRLAPDLCGLGSNLGGIVAKLDHLWQRSPLAHDAQLEHLDHSAGLLRFLGMASSPVGLQNGS